MREGWVKVSLVGESAHLMQATIRFDMLWCGLHPTGLNEVKIYSCRRNKLVMKLIKKGK